MLSSSPESLAAFDQMLLDACAKMRPPEKLSCSQWADKYAMLPPEGASMPGKYYVSNAEYQREPLDAMSDPKVETSVLMWGSQIGKTQIGLIVTGYFVEHDPRPILIVQPTEDMAAAVMTDRIEPTIRDTPILAALFRQRKGDKFHKPFPGGQISMGWANSPAQLASRPIGFAWNDEISRGNKNAEGDAVQQVKKRLATFKGRRKHLLTSSPALRKTCDTTRAFESSDQRHYYVPCPQCGVMQVLRFERLKWEAGKPDTVRYICESGECIIYDHDKYAMIRAGQWIAHNPGGGDGKTAGFHLSGLYSTIGFDWPEIVAEFERAQGIPDKLQVFYNTVLAEPWDEQAEKADLNELQRHAEMYPAEAPAWAIIFTCGADVQPDRIEATKWGWGENSVSGVIEHRIFWGETSNARGGAWLEFDAWRRQHMLHESGLPLPVACTFVDSGDGNRTEQVYEYCRSREREKVYACKGSSQAGAPVVGEAHRVGRMKTLLVMVGTSTAKDTIFARLKIAERDRPGYIHFPKQAHAGCGKEYFDHLTAEALVTRETKGGKVARWEKQRARNESLDCAVYAYAAFLFMRVGNKMSSLARMLEAKAKSVPAETIAQQRKEWQMLLLAEQLADHLGVLPSSANSAPSNSLSAKTSPIRLKKKRKVFHRPGFSWILG
jgi:phage terminase large subunit GpA-like protein